MKLNRYEVTFFTGKIEIVDASCFKDAIILAKAEQIKKGNNHLVKQTKELESGNVYLQPVGDN